MAVFVNQFFEERLEQLFDLAHRVDRALGEAGIEYRVIGGLATYFYVEEAAPDAGRLTRDIDIAVRREDLDRIARAVEPLGLHYRHVASDDMLIQSGQPARRAVHIVFSAEKVRPDYPEPVPDLDAAHTLRGLRLMSLADLVRTKLTSYRLKDQTHVQDLDEAGLITPEIEAALSPVLLQRLKDTRALLNGDVYVRIAKGAPGTYPEHPSESNCEDQYPTSLRPCDQSSPASSTTLRPSS